MNATKDAFDLKHEDAMIFDQMLTEMLREAMPRVVFDVSFWERRMATHTVGSDHYVMCVQRLNESKAKLEEGARRLRLYIPSRMVPCPDAECHGHHATFVGLA